MPRSEPLNGRGRFARGSAVASAVVILACVGMVHAIAGAGPAGTAPTHVGGIVPLRHHAAPGEPQVTNLTYHGGAVMRKQEISYAIYWLPPTLQDGQPTSMSPTYQGLIDRYFDDVGGNRLYRNNTQYYEVKGGKQEPIKNRSSLGATWVDTGAYPPSGCEDPATPGDCLTDAQIQDEVSRALLVNGWTGGFSHMFFVFTSFGEGSCFDGSNNGCAFVDYCAYHGDFWGGKPGNRVIYANMPYLGTTGGCRTPTSPNGDPAADSTINVASHEQMEAVTDPLPGYGWTAPDGEIGDKCVWNFGVLGYDGIANQRWNGHLYVLQQEWSNKLSRCTQTWTR